MGPENVAYWRVPPTVAEGDSQVTSLRLRMGFGVWGLGMGFEVTWRVPPTVAEGDSQVTLFLRVPRRGLNRKP